MSNWQSMGVCRELDVKKRAGSMPEVLDDDPVIPNIYHFNSIYTKHGSQNDNVNI
jgi:hypothetical protein